MTARRNLHLTLGELSAVVALAVVTVAVPPSSPRTWLLVATLTTAPGWSLIAFRPPRSFALTVVGAIALSLAVSILLSLVLLYAHQWHPVPAFWALLGVVAVLLVAHVVRFTRLRTGGRS